MITKYVVYVPDNKQIKSTVFFNVVKNKVVSPMNLLKQCNLKTKEKQYRQNVAIIKKFCLYWRHLNCQIKKPK